jgi:hypothetical protein
VPTGCGLPPRPPTPAGAAPAVRAVPGQIDRLAPSFRPSLFSATFLRYGQPSQRGSSRAPTSTPSPAIQGDLREPHDGSIRSSLLTRRWSKPDSNSRSHPLATRDRRDGADPVDHNSRRKGGTCGRSPRRVDRGVQGHRRGSQRVRIRLPPARSVANLTSFDQALARPGTAEQKRHFSPSGLSDLDRRAVLVGDRGVLHAALSDFDQSAQQNEFLIKGDPVTARRRAPPSRWRRRRQ